MPVRREPLEWYVEAIERGDAFSSLLFGDGEFRVILGDYQGQPYTTYREVVTPLLREELTAALFCEDPIVLKGTDPFLIDYETYGGNDKATITDIGSRIRSYIEGVNRPGPEWVDGTVWDVASREGNFSPLFRALWDRDVILVGNVRLTKSLQFLRPQVNIVTPEQNAYGHVDTMEAASVFHGKPRDVFLVCAGLAGIPLIRRLQNRMPHATFLDLGSSLDVFAGLGAERGWRAELYSRPKEWERIKSKHLGGLG